MTDTTPKLHLPLIAAQQAQKHVTHNEALTTLDALVQASVKDRDLNAPPASPVEGDIYIVAASASGDWAGHEGELAEFRNGGWVFHAPREGWRVWVEDEDKLLAFDAAAWVNVTGGVQSLNPADGGKVGINTTADATNRLAVKSDAVLFSHDDVTPGNGSVQFKINKAAQDKTASLLFQDDWSGRAEVGLIGNDDFTFKVSADGATWHVGIVIDGGSGAVRFPSGGVREQLSADRAYYVNAATGSDANDGLDPSRPFKTIQKAVDVTASLDLGIHDIMIHVADGMYDEMITLKPFIGGGSITIRGNPANPQNVHVRSGSAVFRNQESAYNWKIEHLKLSSTNAGVSLVDMRGEAGITINDLVFAGDCWASMNVVRGAMIKIDGDYTIDGGTVYRHIHCEEGALVTGHGKTVSLLNSPSFTSSFIYAESSIVRMTGFTFSGTATGKRYAVSHNGVIRTWSGGDPDYFPGDQNGSASLGGIYD